MPSNGNASQSNGILIVGGGFAGFWSALAARRVIDGRAPVTLLSREPVLQMRPRLYEADPERLGVDLRPLLHRVGVRFVAGEAADLDPSARTVTLASGERLGYARLVVATGSRMRRPDVPGAASAFSVDTQAEAIAFDRRLAEIAATVPSPTVGVVGAGFTGIELALELRDRLRAHGAEEAAERLRIVLIDRAPVVGPELGAGPRSAIEAALTEARIELRLDAAVQALSANRVELRDGAAVTADAVVLATGLEAAPFASRIPGERDERGRVVVDRALRAPAVPDVFVTGDAAAADTGDGHRTLQSCQHALQLGRFAGENAARDLLGLPTLDYVQRRYVTCLDLGRSGAVRTEGWERIVRQTGAEAKAAKRRINRELIYPPADAPGDALLAMSSTDLAAQGRPPT
ncbi:MAG TPA: FAD-dependent oxidoreductase [Gammaproteobacteria bacterium]